MVWRAKNAWKEAGSASVGSAHLIGGFGERTGSVFSTTQWISFARI